MDPTRPKRLDPVLLQHSQEFQLRFGRNLSNLVKKDGPTLCLLEAAGMAIISACEGAFFHAEQLAVDVALGQGG